MSDGAISEVKPNTLLMREWRRKNPERAREQSLAWAAENREKHRASCKAWAEKNKEYNAARARKWRGENRERSRELDRESKSRQRSTPEGIIRYRVRNRIANALRANEQGRGGKTFELLGYTPEELRVHIERQFLPGMSWSNVGEWHIDHIIPLSSFVIRSKDDPELRLAWALSNLRPLWASENLSKGSKRVTLL